MWKCKKCGCKIQNYIYPINCRCGTLYEDPSSSQEIAEKRGPAVARTPGYEQQYRKQVCRSCDNFSNTKYEMCVSIDLGCQNTWLKYIQEAHRTCPRGEWGVPEIPYVRTAQLISDAMELIPTFPLDLSGVVCIPRSGFLPGTVIASALHLPLFSFSGETLVLLDGGKRMSLGGDVTLEAIRQEGVLLWVDDTIGSGQQIRVLRESNIIHAEDWTTAVYITDWSRGAVDSFHTVLQAPHLLEWNLFNGPTITHSATDLDGVLCYDGSPSKPLHLPRNKLFHPRGIITARPEEERKETEAWLKRYRVQYRNLLMWPGKPEDRNLMSVSHWKAAMCRSLDVDFYIESDSYISVEMRKEHIRVLDLNEGVLK